MSIDLLQEKIRKIKNPSVVDVTATPEMIPPMVWEVHENYAQAYSEFCRTMLDALQEKVPAVRFRFSHFALMGQEGLSVLQDMLDYAMALDYYVLLDCVDILSPMMAEFACRTLFAEDTPWHYHGLIVSAYIGSDGLKPFAKALADTDKGLFGVIRTGNKSASELQDLFTGNRLSHMATADLVNRLGEPMAGKNGYSRIGGLAGAASADSLKMLRSKYSRLFLLLDGYDYPNANAKTCSNAFDQFGHGAAAIAGSSVLGAWMEEGADPKDYIQLAVDAAERMKKNLCRYVTIL